MEIVKIGEKTWRISVVSQIHQSFLPPMFFTVWYLRASPCQHKFHCMGLHANSCVAS